MFAVSALANTIPLQEFGLVAVTSNNLPASRLRLFGRSLFPPGSLGLCLAMSLGFFLPSASRFTTAWFLLVLLVWLLALVAELVFPPPTLQERLSGTRAVPK